MCSLYEFKLIAEEGLSGRWFYLGNYITRGTDCGTAPGLFVRLFVDDQEYSKERSGSVELE